ncbi:MAG: hypothetical protein GEU98_07085 [Pseudonocardiaceae bacterium]|nr:hypothetical protein [Pseudonocardiaceae bacterium]
MTGHGTPADERARQERFARALEAGRPAEVSATNEFGRELGIVDALRAIGDQAEPGTATKARIARRIERYPARGRPRQRARARLAASLVAGFCLLLALPALLLARDALPGDPLYALKRAGEQAELALSTDGDAEARKHLEFASERLDELALLAEQPDSAPEAFRRAFDDFASETTEGVAVLIPAATNSDGQQLKWLNAWADTQADRLRGSLPGLPAHAEAPRASSLALLAKIEDRASALWKRMRCPRITSGRTDELGALPAAGPCTGFGQRGRYAVGPPSVRRSAPDGDPPALVEAETAETAAPSVPTTPAPTPIITPTRESAATPARPSTTPTRPTPTAPRPPAAPDRPELRVPLPTRLGSVPPLVPGLPTVRIG